MTRNLAWTLCFRVQSIVAFFLTDVTSSRAIVVGVSSPQSGR